MKKGKIYINPWELMAADHPLWHCSIYQATTKFETNRLLHKAEKWQGLLVRLKDCISAIKSPQLNYNFKMLITVSF